MTEIESLLRERHGYVTRGLSNRIAEVDAALAALGHTPAAAVEVAADPVQQETAARRVGRPRKAD